MEADMSDWASAIGHVALKVADIERSLAFYRDRLGFREIMRLNHDTGELWLVYLRITDTQFLELFPDGEGNDVARIADERRSIIFAWRCGGHRRDRASPAGQRRNADGRAKDGRGL
jgi:catechol 2,3-dioxygenase-like lactoylglutathione lyase family enzyme